MDKNNLHPKYSDILSTQSYKTKVPIEGVKFIPIKYMREDSGEFVELGRIENGLLKGLEKYHVAQISHSLLMPGAIKAFHIHFNQTDVWFVSPHERMLVGLLDTRRNSPTADSTMRFILGAGVAQLLVIPEGVAHGAANPWDKPIYMTYFANQQFDPRNPDEHRLPFDLFGSDFWKIKQG